MKLLRELESSAKVVGVISNKHGILWTVSEYRKDRRTGATTSIPMSDYWRDMQKRVSVL